MSDCAICRGVKFCPRSWTQWFCCLPPSEYLLDSCCKCNIKYHYGCLQYHLLVINDKHNQNDTFNSEEHKNEMNCPNPACDRKYKTDEVAKSFQDYRNKNNFWTCEFILTIMGLLHIFITMITIDHISTSYIINNIEKWCLEYNNITNSNTTDFDYCAEENKFGIFNHFILWLAGYFPGFTLGSILSLYLSNVTVKHPELKWFCINDKYILVAPIVNIFIKLYLSITYIFQMGYNDRPPGVSHDILRDPRQVELYWYLYLIPPCYFTAGVTIIELLILGVTVLAKWIKRNGCDWNLCCANFKYVGTQWCCDIRDRAKNYNERDYEARLGVIVV